MASKKQLQKMRKEMDRLWKLAWKQAKAFKPFLADNNFSKYYKLRGKYVKLKRLNETQGGSE